MPKSTSQSAGSLRAKGRKPNVVAKVVALFEDVKPAAIIEPERVAPPPEWLPRRAKQLWVDHVEVYRWRGQRIQGTEKALAQYCLVEAKMIDAWLEDRIPHPSIMNVYLRLAIQFYDTPASQRVVIKGNEDQNRFSGNGAQNRKRAG